MDNGGGEIALFLLVVFALCFVGGAIDVIRGKDREQDRK